MSRQTETLDDARSTAGSLGNGTHAVFPTLLLLFSPAVAHIGARVDLASVRSARLDRGADTFAAGALEDGRMSRAHAIVERSDRAGWQVRDCGSRNGTYLNGERVSLDRPVALSDGDVIRTGKTLSMFRVARRWGGTPGPDIPSLVGHGDAIRALRGVVALAAGWDASVLLLGETGTGKEVVAEAIARLGPRSARPFIAFSGTVPSDLVDAHLFGHEKGAFSGAVRAQKGVFREADGGTVFLDEIGDYPMALQTRLLRVLETGEVHPLGSSGAAVRVDVRVIAATNRDLLAATAAGAFRSDLYARISAVPIRLPALRERREDVPMLADYFVNGPRPATGERRFSASTMWELVRYDWPQNVRELRNVCQAAAAMTPAGEPVRLTAELRAEMAARQAALQPDAPLPLPLASREPVELDRERVVAALRECRGNLAHVAARLDRNRSSLYRTLERLGIDPKDYRG